jgi:hypothetical protein
MELALVGLLAWDLRVRAIRLRPSLPPAAATMVLGSCAIAIVLLTSAAFALAGGNPEDDVAHEAATSPEVAVGSPTPQPTPAPAGSGTPVAAVAPGEIRFGTTLELTGEIATPAARFAPGETAVWVAEFSDPPDVPEIRLLIVQVLPDGREFEHWRQEIPLADPGARRLVAGADLSIYVHGGEGSYRMRYLRGDVLLAEGAFEFAP